MDVLYQKKRHQKNQLLKQLRDAGYTTKKGKFGAIKTKKDVNHQRDARLSAKLNVADTNLVLRRVSSRNAK